MKTKKTMTVILFLLLIFCTAVLSIALAVISYNIDINDNDHFFDGFGAVLCILVGGFSVLYEADLFCTVYYFLFKPKTKSKTVLNVLSNLSLVFLGGYVFLIESFMWFRKYESPELVVILFLSYVILRIAYFAVCAGKNTQDGTERQ